MKKVKLALLGCGRLNAIVAEAHANGYLPEYELVGAYGRNPLKTQTFAEHFQCKPCHSIEELLALEPDIVAEAASPEAVRDYSEIVLQGGASLVVITIGVFADTAFYNRVKQTAVENKQKIYIASGAVGGFDVLRTAALMSPIKATMTSKKSLRSLSFTPFFTEELLQITEPTQVFSGTTKKAIEVLPFHFNVAVATALASAGPEQTTLNIDATPNFIGDEYKIEIEGEEVKTDLNIYSRTPRIAGWSIVAVLRNIVSPVVF
ncbi:aspartate dehydrogenase domain-containing protein [Paenibacillus yanchengensis]|uniref:L-aspartate dehydrogenase n=1 Tax=Paenibacillus yanchengensis TaxID=2035833 RepID=A0ABW4YJ32_9BACL